MEREGPIQLCSLSIGTHVEVTRDNWWEELEKANHLTVIDNVLPLA
jgi:hypothetical protein